MLSLRGGVEAVEAGLRVGTVTGVGHRVVFWEKALVVKLVTGAGIMG